MMILKLDYIFAPLFCFLFCERYSKKFHFLYISLILAGLAPLHLNKKIQKMNRHLLDKSLDVFPQNSKLKIVLINLNDNLKNRCHSKINLDHAVFPLLFESTFSFLYS